MSAFMEIEEQVSNTCKQKGKSEPLVFPMVYGGITLNNPLEYYMIDNLSIKSLRWLRDIIGNQIAGRLISDIDRLEQEKREKTKDYIKKLHEKVVGEKEPIVVKKPLKELASRISYIPNEVVEKHSDDSSIFGEHEESEEIGEEQWD